LDLIDKELRRLRQAKEAAINERALKDIAERQKRQREEQKERSEEDRIAREKKREEEMMILVVNESCSSVLGSSQPMGQSSEGEEMPDPSCEPAEMAT